MLCDYGLKIVRDHESLNLRDILERNLLPMRSSIQKKNIQITCIHLEFTFVV